MTDNPIKSPDLCERCRYSAEICEPLETCADCPQHSFTVFGMPLCNCDLIKTGTPCPYFKEVEL